MLTGANIAIKRRSRSPHCRTTEIRMDKGRSNEMPPQHLGCHVVLAVELGGRRGW